MKNTTHQQPTQNSTDDFFAKYGNLFSAQKPIKKYKPTRTTITTKGGKGFDVTTKDFVYFLNESFMEIYDKPMTEWRKEQREILFETYFAFRFLAREFNWKEPREIKDFRKVIDDYFGQYLRESLPPAFAVPQK